MDQKTELGEFFQWALLPKLSQSEKMNDAESLSLNLLSLQLITYSYILYPSLESKLEKVGYSRVVLWNSESETARRLKLEAVAETKFTQVATMRSYYNSLHVNHRIANQRS